MAMPTLLEDRETERQQAPGPVRFIVLAYLIAWAWAVPIAIAGLTVERGQGWPTHIPSLLAPLLAALITIASTEGRSGLRGWFERIGRWRIAAVWWLVALSPLVVLGSTLLFMGFAGQDVPGWSDFASFGGLPVYGVVVTFLLVLVLNGIGEEAGWRGYLQDRLQSRFEPLPATLIVSLVWALWHTPFFFVLATYAGFNTMTLVMFPLGLASGAIVLTWLYNRTGRSILAVAVWHALYNMAVATKGATDLIQAVVSTAVMVAAAVLVGAEVRAHRRGERSVLGPRRSER